MDKIIKVNKETFNAHDNGLTRLVDDALAGLVEPLDTYILFKKLETTIKEAIKLLQDGATEDAIKYGKGDHLVQGTYINVKASAGRWVFSDRVQAAKDELKRLQEQEKAAYKNNVVMVDEDGVEIPKANYFQGKEIVSIKVPKI